MRKGQSLGHVPRGRPSGRLRLMRPLLDYRSEFPILEQTTYLINHSLGAMPRRRGGRPRRVRADVARAWDPGLGRGLVGSADDRRRPDRPHRRRARGHDRDAPERRDRRGRRALLLPADAGAEPGRLRARQLPVRALPLPGAARPRGRRLRGRRGDRRRRSTSGRCSSRSATSSSSRARSRTSPGSSRGARGRRARDPRRLPVGRDRPARRHRARRRLRRRRLGQVALRRPRQRLALRSPRSRRPARADVHRLAGARDPVRLRGGDASTPPARPASSPGRRTSRRSTPRPPATT